MGRPPDCRAVGGYVRDRLLGRATVDLDLAVRGSVDDAEPNARRLAERFGARPHLLGNPPHRVWRIDTTALKIELWPTGRLGLEDDIRRRDFTVNALAWKLPDGPLVDLVGGLDDLAAGRLRVVARVNLQDDPVRLLRGPRFLAQLPAFELDGDSRGWIAELAPRLADAPRERIGQELLTLLRGPAASRGLGGCLDLGLVRPSAPVEAAVDRRWLEQNAGAIDVVNAVSRTTRTLGSLSSDAARLGLLIRAWGCPPALLLAPYSWPKAGRDRAVRAARMLDRAVASVDAGPADRRELAWQAGEAFPALVALGRAVQPDRAGWGRWLRQWRRAPSDFTDPEPPLSGSEIAELAGVEPGPELGRLVEALLRARVRGEIRSRRGAARRLKGLKDSSSESR